MASAARDMRYRGKQAVNGSLAYDLDYAVRERALRHAGEAPKAREKAKVYEAPRVLLRARQVVSPLAVLSVAAIMGLALLVLMSYVQLTMLSADTVKLQSQLEELESENVALTAQYQRMFDMASVKEAAEAAGMTQPSESQIYYVDLPGEDQAVAYGGESTGVLERIFTSAGQGICAAVEYFQR